MMPTNDDDQTDAMVTLLAPRPMAGRRLLILPHAGATPLAYGPLTAQLDPSIEPWVVSYPEDQGNSPLSWDAIVEALVETTSNRPGKDWILFGHSLGAVMALSLARRWEAEGRPPIALIVSGRPWPGSAEGVNVEIETILADPFKWLEGRFGPPPPGFDNPHLQEAALPQLQRDLARLHHYQYSSSSPLSVPMTVLYGRDDPSVAPENVQSWETETTGPCQIIELAGGHYGPMVDPSPVAAAIKRATHQSD